MKTHEPDGSFGLPVVLRQNSLRVFLVPEVEYTQKPFEDILEELSVQADMAPLVKRSAECPLCRVQTGGAPIHEAPRRSSLSCYP